MTRSLRITLLLAVVAAFFTTSQAVQAQCCGRNPFSSAFGFYPNYYVDQRPPYFAQFPPVYYKAPIIARHYGESPFPYPACGCVGETIVEEIKPAMIQNPFVQPKTADEVDLKEASHQREIGPQPLRIRNPYYQANDRQASTRQDRETGRIYPTAAFAAKR